MAGYLIFLSTELCFGGWDMGELVRLYEAVVSNAIAYGFSLAIVVLLIFAVLLLIYQTISGSERLSSFTRAAATLFTTIGVLGTFFGIFIGLLDFDVANIDASIQQLLTGLKIAFSTSIVGMGAATAFTVLKAITPSTSETSEVTPERIYSALAEIRDDARENSKNQSEALEQVRNAISSEGDTSLLTQIQKLRTSVQDGHAEMVKEFRSFAEQMAENNSKAIIEALENVIKDFNKQLTEQFGENFKQLNEAVGALLTWQENYRTHLEQLEKAFGTAVQGIQAAESSLSKISEHTSAIPSAMDKVDPLLTGMQQQVTNLSSHLEGLAALRAQAIEAFPVIEANLEKVTDQLAASVTSSIERASAGFEEQKSSFDTLSKGYHNLQNQASDAQERFHSEFEKILKGMEAELASAFQSHSSTIETTASEMTRQIAEAWTKTEEAINKQMGALDEQLQNELGRALEIMGRNLASISEKFVADYDPLAEKLAALVRSTNTSKPS